MVIENTSQRITVDQPERSPVICVGNEWIVQNVREYVRIEGSHMVKVQPFQ